MTTTTMPPVIALSDRELTRLAQVVHAQAGITLGPEKRPMIEARLAKLVRRVGRPLGDLLRELESGRDAEVLDDLLDVLTTNYTSFFREREHFEWLANTWIPAHAGGATVWCAACATGEEAYTLRIVFDDARAARPGMGAFELYASDLSRRALELAQGGTYPANHVTSLDRGLVRRWFQRGVGGSDGQVRVRPELRSRIRFFRHNLLEQPPVDRVDLIFLRNVMIYFDDPTQTAVLARMREALAPGGYLVVGHAENVRRLGHGFRMHGHTLLEKV